MGSSRVTTTEPNEPRFLQQQPPTHIQAIIWLKLNLKNHGQWLYVKPQAQPVLDWSLSCCPVCNHLTQSKLSLPAFSIAQLNYRLAGRKPVQLERMLITVGQRSKLTKEVVTFWAGQCSECLTIYWSCK